MKRTSLATGIILPALLALVPACDDPFVCPGQHIDCGQICVDLAADDLNCGACGTVCPSGESCVAMACVPDAVVCTAPELDCGGACVDVSTSEQHCGACDTACSSHGECIAGDCAEPLAAMQTVFETKNTIDRDLYVLQDLTYALTRLNPTGATTRVIDHAVLPDGRVLLVAAQDEDVFELWLASPRGTGLVRVNGALVSDGDVLPGIVVSRDGRRVLYRADQDTDDVIDLYAVDLATPGTSHKVNGRLVAGGEVSRVFALSATGDRATYIADQDTDGLNELYTVDLSAAAPGPATKLNAVATEPVWDMVMAPDGRRVVYRIENSQLGRLELRLVDVANPGVAPAIVHADGAEGRVESYQLSADGTAVFFTGGRDYFDESLWRAPLAPLAEATRLVDAGTYEWVRPDFQVTADGSGVVFRKVSGAFGFDRLFRVNVASPLLLQQLSPAGDSSAEEVTDFTLADSGTAVIYRGGADGAEGGNYQPGTDGPFTDERRAPAIYHLDLAQAPQPTPTTLSAALPLGAEGIAGGYIVTADGTRVIYRADHDVNFITDAYLVALETAGTARKVSPPLGGVGESSDVSRLTRF
jgi:hypothetical protein